MFLDAGLLRKTALRALLTEISSEKNTNTIVFPLPLDLIKPIYDRLTGSGDD